MRSKVMRVVLVLGVAIAGMVMGVEPASATTYSVAADLEFGRRDLVTSLGTFNRDTPGTGVPGCPETKTLAADFDDVTNEVRNFTLGVKEPFVLPIFGGNYQLEAAGVERADGTWDPSSGAFAGATERFNLQIQNFNPTGCVKGAVICQASLEMQFSGTTRHQHAGGPVEGPIPGATGPVWVRGTTTQAIALTGPCSAPFSFLLPGATLRIDENPTDPAHGTDPGAEYR